MKIFRANPKNEELLNKLFFMSLGDDWENEFDIKEAKERFMRCKNDIFYSVDDIHCEHFDENDPDVEVITGLIACRRCNADDIKEYRKEFANFYPTPNNVVYEIEDIMTIEYATKSTDHPSTGAEIALELLNTNSADKNEAFIISPVLYDMTYATIPTRLVLAYNQAHFKAIGKTDRHVIFVKAPTMHVTNSF